MANPLIKVFDQQTFKRILLAAVSPTGLNRRMHVPGSWWSWFQLTFILCPLVICGSSACAEALQLSVGFSFDEPSGGTRTGQARGEPIALQISDYSGASIDRPSIKGAGNSRSNLALAFGCPLGAGTNGGIAAVTNSAGLALGNVSAFTATMWFRQNTQMPGNLGPRLFLLGAAESAKDTGSTNSIGLKFQSPSCLHFQLNEVIAEADLVWSLPPNEWLFAAMVYDGRTIFVYLGAEERPATLRVTKTAPGKKVAFGETGTLLLGNRADRARCFDGAIDEFRFYTGAADAIQVEGIRKSIFSGDTAPALSQNKAVRSAASSPNWVVVSPPAFFSTLTPLIEKRRMDGYAVSVVLTTNVLSQEQIESGEAGPLVAHVGTRFKRNAGTGHLLLAGLPPGEGIHWTHALPAPAGSNGRMKGKGTDFAFSLPDMQGFPTVAVGRFPARTIDELRVMVAKTLQLEQSPAPGSWRKRMVLLQGNPGGGFLAEAFVDGIARARMNQLHPAWELMAVSHNGPSRFYMPTAFLAQEARDVLSHGQLFSVYLGHSGPEGLFSVKTNFMTADTWAQIDTGKHGVFFTCGCFGCQPDSERGQSYGLAAIRNPHGPAAIIGAIGASYSAPGLLAVDGLLRACMQVPFPGSLADYWLGVQMGIAQGEISDTVFRLMDSVDGTGGKTTLPAQRREHLEMWTLLGDPALRLPIIPQSLTLTTPGSARAGGALLVEGEVPADLTGAEISLTLERPAGSRAPGVKTVPPKSSNNDAERQKLMAENCRLTNERTILRAKTAAAGTHFKCSLAVPADLESPVVIIRAFAEAGSKCGEAVVKLPVMAGDL